MPEFGVATRFKPGQTGNPGGRPKKLPITHELAKLVSADDGRNARALAELAIKKALDGDFRYFREILDRIDGKVVERQEHSHSFAELTDDELLRLATGVLGGSGLPGPDDPDAAPALAPDVP